MPKAARSSLRRSAPAGSGTTTGEGKRGTRRKTRAYGRSRRLPDKASFDRVFARARRSRDRPFTVLFRPNDIGEARLGLAIAKKNCRQAVARNRLKRIIRESFRTHQASLGGLDIVVMNHKGAEALSNRELFDSLAAHWQRLGAARRGKET